METKAEVGLTVVPAGPSSVGGRSDNATSADIQRTATHRAETATEDVGTGGPDRRRSGALRAPPRRFSMQGGVPCARLS